VTRQLKRIPAFLFILAIAFASFARAETLPASERQKIEALIEAVESLPEARFVRNGSAYSADSAAYFLRRKWQANASEVRTALDFIKNVASFSGTSGKPYLIRFKDGKELTSRDFLLGELGKMTQSGEPH
jgi:hypothetical protein